jgi:hypothetical protein
MAPFFVAVLLAVSAPPPDSPQPKERATVYLDALLSDPSTVYDGYSRFRAMKVAQLGSLTVRHALVSEAHMHRDAPARFSAVSFELGKRFQSFDATLGRDNLEQEFGRSYCYFEVYADGRKIYSSPAMRSSLSSVFAESGSANKVKAPQDVRIDVSDVNTLKLVIQMPEFGQRGDFVHRAAGCVFGEARLTLKPGQTLPPPPPKDDSPGPYRRAIRLALDSLLRKLPEPGGEPQKLALAPFRLDEGGSGTSAGWWIYLSEQLDRQTIRPETFRLLEGPAQAEFARLLPPSKDEASPAREAIERAARNVGADWFLDARLTQGEKGWQIELEVRDTNDGALIARSVSKVVQPAGNL